MTLALASEAADAAKEGSGAAQQRAFAMSPFACVMAAWCALRSDSLTMLQAALSVFAEVRNASAFLFVFVLFQRDCLQPEDGGFFVGS